MSFDTQAVAAVYAAGATEYAEKFADDLVDNDFDRLVLTSVVRDVPATGCVLDVGCGPAQVSSLALQLGRDAVGVDITPEMLAVARARVGVPLVCGDVLRLPFAPGTFDAAICWYSLHNLPRGLLPDALSELARVVRVGGVVALATHAGHGEAWYDDVVVTYYEPSALVVQLQAAGFTHVVLRTRPPRATEHAATKLIVSARR